jgi:hypothetical protein
VVEVQAWTGVHSMTGHGLTPCGEVLLRLRYTPSAAAAAAATTGGRVPRCGAVASFLAAVLTEIYLRNVCSCQEILRRNV